MTQHRKGGRAPSQASPAYPFREALWEKMSQLEEGTVFTPDMILEGFPPEAKKDFAYMNNHEHVALSATWHTAIREGRFNRLLPDPEKVVASWAQAHAISSPVLFGDWHASRIGLYPWEPIAGYRFRASAGLATDVVLSLGHMRLRIEPTGPMTWLASDEPTHLLARAFYDMPHKTFGLNLKNWIGNDYTRKEQVKRVMDFLQEQDSGWENTPIHWRAERPTHLAQMMKDTLG